MYVLNPSGWQTLKESAQVCLTYP